MSEEPADKSDDRYRKISDLEKSLIHKRVKPLLKDKRFSELEILEVLVASPSTIMYVPHKTKKRAILYIWQGDRFEEAKVIGFVGSDQDRNIDFELYGVRGTLYIPAPWREGKAPEGTYGGCIMPLLRMEIRVSHLQEKS